MVSVVSVVGVAGMVGWYFMLPMPSLCCRWPVRGLNSFVATRRANIALVDRRYYFHRLLLFKTNTSFVWKVLSCLCTLAEGLTLQLWYVNPFCLCLLADWLALQLWFAVFSYLCTITDWLTLQLVWVLPCLFTLNRLISILQNITSERQDVYFKTKKINLSWLKFYLELLIFYKAHILNLLWVFLVVIELWQAIGLMSLHQFCGMPAISSELFRTLFWPIYLSMYPPLLVQDGSYKTIGGRKKASQQMVPHSSWRRYS